MRELKARDALDQLVALLASPNMTVRRQAATACLRVAEHDSISALEKVAADGGFDDGIPAREALDNWRKNGFVVYGV
jgi:HEAT repeat protein